LPFKPPAPRIKLTIYASIFINYLGMFSIPISLSKHSSGVFMSNAFANLQKIGKSLMLPVSVLPVAGILLGVGSANFSWLPAVVSQIMAQAGGAVFGNMALIFAIGVALGFTNNDGVAALAATVGYAILTKFCLAVLFPLAASSTLLFKLIAT
jgi:phosphotransferase system  glucose/maltose/N-acetylglucosamine-specific IIC component